MEVILYNFLFRTRHWLPTLLRGKEKILRWPARPSMIESLIRSQWVPQMCHFTPASAWTFFPDIYTPPFTSHPSVSAQTLPSQHFHLSFLLYFSSSFLNIYFDAFVSYLAALGQSWHVGSSVFIAACRIFSCSIQTLSWGKWDLVPWPGIEPGPPELGVWSLSHWMTREVPPPLFFYKTIITIQYIR